MWENFKNAVAFMFPNPLNPSGPNGVITQEKPTVDTQKSMLNDAVDNSMLGSIKNDIEWLIIALVGLLAYVFIFKR